MGLCTPYTSLIYFHYYEPLVLLFHPFRNEVLEVHNNENILEKYKECKEVVEEEQRLFEPHHEFIDFLENIEKENIEEDEEQQEQLDNDFVEEDTTKPEDVQDWLKKQGKIYDGTKIRLEDKKKLNKRINTHTHTHKHTHTHTHTQTHTRTLTHTNSKHTHAHTHTDTHTN